MENLVYFIVGLIGFAVLIVIFVVIKRLKNKLTAEEKKYYRQKWQEIQNEKDYRNALLTADKLLEKVMRRKGYRGSLGEMLKKGKKDFSDLNSVWYAHKIRNKLAHELDYQLSPKEAQKGLRSFQKALCELGAL